LGVDGYNPVVTFVFLPIFLDGKKGIIKVGAVFDLRMGLGKAQHHED
jgi:hypothetical protein